jgi:polyphosphate kinase 2 (PPK2 family)
LEQEHQRQHKQHQNLVLQQQQLIVNHFFNVVTNLDGGDAEKPTPAVYSIVHRENPRTTQQFSPQAHCIIEQTDLNLK